MISALAIASGHHLVRINLSEQTDISDLMGNDLPYTSDDNADSISQASFRWCDGVLLQAIKRGDWVLLDELNLASQSVLEGLNSCLDHRASVYIPELGKSFDCPPSFRIFAAQNPLAQGGGRKGLPKSFLNRFTKVYVEALTRDDLLNIVSDQFRSIPISLIESMVDINCGVQEDVVQKGIYGQQGSPWEFNLRDVFRWCQLLNANGTSATPALVAKYADILYTQRLRTKQDRDLVKARFDHHLGADAVFRSRPRLSVSETQVTVGTITLDRNRDIFSWSDIPTEDTEPHLSHNLFGCLEAVASCVKMNWPCLLVGSSSCGKNTILKTLGDAMNVHVETLAMSSSTDVTELIGCYEQTDSMKVYKNVLRTIHRIYSRLCLSHAIGADMLHSIVKSHSIIFHEAPACSDSFVKDDKIFSAAHELLDCYDSFADCSPEFKRVFSSDIVFCRRWLSSAKKKCTQKETQSPFEWVDGTLVQAMEHGYWLHLDNVNFCPSSVLDRLNPLMEFGGQLVVTECGIADNARDATPRVIQPHPNFRLFLSMNPSSHGEVSRAMRNRCIEVCIIQPALEVCNSHGVETNDACTGLWDCDVRSDDIGQYMLATHCSDSKQSICCHEEALPIKTLKGWGTLFSSLLKRGISSPLARAHDLLYETNDRKLIQITPTFSVLMCSIASRRDLLMDSLRGDIAHYGRLMRVMASDDQLWKLSSTAPTDFNLPELDASSQLGMDAAKLRFQAICRLLEGMHFEDITELLSFLDGYCPELSSQIKVAVLQLSLILDQLPQSSKYGMSFLDIIDESGLGRSKVDKAPAIAITFHHSVEEAFTYHQLNDCNVIPAIENMNVVAASYFISEKRIDVTDLKCPVTPLMYPLLQAVGELLQSTTTACTSEIDVERTHVASCRNRLWHFLKRSCNICVSSSLQLHDNFGGFLINYTWMKKAIDRLSDNDIMLSFDSEVIDTLRQLQLSFEKTDRIIEESMGGSISSSDVLWKKGGHPVLPSSLCNLRILHIIQDIAKQCALTKDELFGFTSIVSSTTSQINADKLVSENHPSLFVDRGFISQLLGAMSTIYGVTTDEIKGRTPLSETYSCDIVASSVAQSFAKQRAAFIADLNFATIDTTIKTVENVIDLESMKDLGDCTKSRQSDYDFVHKLVNRLGHIQSSQIGM